MYMYSFAFANNLVLVSVSPLSATDIHASVSHAGYMFEVSMEDSAVVSWEYQQ